MDQILFIDVECTCWAGDPPSGMVQEIIEIGLCRVDVTRWERLDKRSLLIRPSKSTVSEFCTELTTLTQADVDQGMSFAEACALLRSEYRSLTRAWASYGDFDRKMFERQCRLEGVEYPFGSRHINVKLLFALMHRLPTEIGMAGALAKSQ